MNIYVIAACIASFLVGFIPMSIVMARFLENATSDLERSNRLNAALLFEVKHLRSLNGDHEAPPPFDARAYVRRFPV